MEFGSDGGICKSHSLSPTVNVKEVNDVSIFIITDLFILSLQGKEFFHYK